MLVDGGQGARRHEGRVAPTTAQIAGYGALGPGEQASFCAALDRTRHALIRRSDRSDGIRLKSHACVGVDSLFPAAVATRRVGRRLSKVAGS